jgi:hypothetical protein
VKVLQEAVALLPQNATVRYHLAVAYLKTKQKPGAAAELRRALTISTTFPEAKLARKGAGLARRMRENARCGKTFA